MKLFLAIGVAGLLAAGCGDQPAIPAAPAAKAGTHCNSGNPVTAPADYPGAVVNAQQHAQQVIEVSSLNQAIQLFNAQEGRPPKTLAELVPNYIGKLPEAPLGSKMFYDAAAGTVKVVKQ